MKKILVLATVLLMGSSYAQSSFEENGWGMGRDSGMGTGQAASGGDTHMIESNVESLIRGAYSFDKSKQRGSAADNDSQLDLVMNYAMKFKDNWQGGVRLNYLKGTRSTGDTENYGFQVGAFYNFSENLMESYYLSLFTGLQWNHSYGNGTVKDELWKTTLAAGKRFTLGKWNIAHLVYSPEVALVSANSTTGAKASNLEYTQNIQLRFLQFSLFF